jgi:hypothetical protein
VKLAWLVAVPAGVVTVMGPVAAPEGTVVTIWVAVADTAGPGGSGTRRASRQAQAQQRHPRPGLSARAARPGTARRHQATRSIRMPMPSPHDVLAGRERERRLASAANQE